MSILIKNMEMPKNCVGCPICCGLPYQYRDAKGRRPDCPLVEFPTPHGRLVDLDQMIEDYWDGSAMRIDETDLKEIEKYDVTIEAEDRT